MSAGMWTILYALKWSGAVQAELHLPLADKDGVEVGVEPISDLSEFRQGCIARAQHVDSSLYMVVQAGSDPAMVARWLREAADHLTAHPEEIVAPAAPVLARLRHARAVRGGGAA